MNHEVRFTRPARKDLRRLDRKDQQRVVEAAESLADEPRPQGAEPVKNTPYLRIRVGQYRIVYEVRDEELLILVIRAAHRREVYRRLP